MAFAFAADRFVGVGTAESVIVSTNGTDWALARSGDISYYFEDICYAEGIGFVAVGRNSVGVSQDGWQWTTANAPTDFYGVAAGGGLVCAVGYHNVFRETPGGVYTSRDGLAWRKVSDVSDFYIGRIVYGDGRFVAITPAAIYTATVALPPPPRLSAKPAAGSLELTASGGAAGWPYVLQRTMDLTTGLWENLSTNRNLPSFRETIEVEDPMQFLRLKGLF
jgi:hypothetical protein